MPLQNSPPTNNTFYDRLIKNETNTYKYLLETGLTNNYTQCYRSLALHRHTVEQTRNENITPKSMVTEDSDYDKLTFGTGRARETCLAVTAKRKRLINAVCSILTRAALALVHSITLWKEPNTVLVNILFMAPRMVYSSIINLVRSLMSKMSTTFRSVSYGPCSRTGVTSVASDFSRIIEK